MSDCGTTLMELFTTPSTSLTVAALVRSEGARLGLRPLLSFDLAGPKLRTGPIRPGPAVVHWSPTRNESGAILAPARILLCEAGSTLRAPAHTPAGAAVLPLLRGGSTEVLLATASPGDLIAFVDAAGRHRTIVVERRIEHVTSGTAADVALVCVAVTSAYVVEGTTIDLFVGPHALRSARHARRRAEDEDDGGGEDSPSEANTPPGTAAATAQVAPLPPAAGFLVLAAGDVVRVESGSHDGYTIDDADRTKPGSPVAVITVDVPEVFSSVR